MSVGRNYYLLPLFFAILLTSLHFIANAYSLYWSLWWYDTALHFLGGILIATMLIWIIYRTEFFSFSKPVSVFFIALGTLVIAIVWELYEYEIGFTYHHFASYGFDTFKDIVSAFSAAILFAIIFITPKTLAESNDKN